MKMGLFITSQQTLDTDMVIPLDDQFAMVRFARDRGWDSLFSGQHYLNEGNNKQLQTVPLNGRVVVCRHPDRRPRLLHGPDVHVHVFGVTHHHSHALGGDAIVHVAREHASDLGRAPALAAGSLAWRRPAGSRAERVMEQR